jgi:N4-gp56 family major capsid protein
MAVTTYGVGDSLTAKRWSRILQTEALMATEIAPLIGEGSNAIIQRKDEPKREKGDQVTIGLRTKLFGDGVSEGQTLEGNEESLTTYAQSLVLNELAHAVRVKGERTIDAQRILFDMRKEAKDGLKDWWAERLSIGFFLHACGYNGASYTHRSLSVDKTKTVYNLGNSITAHTTNRKIFAAAGAGESNTTDEGIESDDVFDLSYIDYAKEKARTASIPLRPAKVDGGEFYVMYLHPYQVTDLRRSTDTGQWMDFMRAAYTGRGKDSPLFSGALGMYNGVILRESEHVTPGVNSTTFASISTVRRAVFLGAQACLMGMGSEFNAPSGEMGSNAVKWVEETFDYGRELGVSMQSLLGLRKSVFNSEDFGCITVSTYAAAHG